MSKRKKVIIIILSIVTLFFIIFTPVPKKTALSDGNALSLTALTYRVVIWDMFTKSEKPYNKTELFLPPKNFISIQELWQEKSSNLQNKGYGAVTFNVMVTEKNELNLIVTEITENKNGIFIIEKDIFETVCKDITFEDVDANTRLSIATDGFILETYPASFQKIYRIKPIKTTTNIIGDRPIKNNTENTTTQQNNTDINTSSNKDNSENNNITNNSSIENSSTNSTISSVITSSNYTGTDKEPLTNNKPYFWDQPMHRYDDYYDEISDINLPYRVIEPADYNKNNTYPVILFLHGAGDGYPDLNSPKFNKQQVFVLEDSYESNYYWLNQAIIIAPQLSSDLWWNFHTDSTGTLDAVMRLFNKVITEFSCDSNRFYVMGSSMGGHATWEIAARYNNLFAAAMPMCAATSDISHAPQLINMPIRLIHGTADNIVSVEYSKQKYNAIIAAGGNKVVLKLYEGADHDLWRFSYFDDETWKWLFNQKKQ